jgi:hypothetical protein
MIIPKTARVENFASLWHDQSNQDFLCFDI